MDWKSETEKDRLTSNGRIRVWLFLFFSIINLVN